MHIRRCIREDEIYDILKAYHDGPCGGHFVDRKTRHKILQMGCYWPLHPQLVIKPFKCWALDFIGPINPSSNKKSYILVATEYVTKWVEVVALPRETEETVINFLFEIFVRYGLSREIITDGGPQFVGHKIFATLKNHHILYIITSPYHP